MLFVGRDDCSLLRSNNRSERDELYALSLKATIADKFISNKFIGQAEPKKRLLIALCLWMQ